MTIPTLHPADRVEITVLVDNYTDMFLIQNTENTRRPVFLPPKALLAEHGFSCLIQVFSGRSKHTFLMDAGVSSSCLMHNADLLGVDLNTIDGVVLSHGHPDHFGGLIDVVKTREGISLYCHPDAFLERRMNNPAAGPRGMPTLDEESLKKHGVRIHTSRGMVLLASDCIGLTGEVERRTPFENGIPMLAAKIDGDWIIDPLLDDQGLVVNVQGKGLVIICGCAHAGIVNTVFHAQRVTGIDTVHAVLGGFHLTGPYFAPIIQPTIDEMKRINPDYIVPMHCTGWSAMTRFEQEMPDKFILNTVGTTYIF